MTNDIVIDDATVIDDTLSQSDKRLQEQRSAAQADWFAILNYI